MKTKIELETAELVYIAEGNANIVLKLPEHGQVLRLRKSIKGSGQQQTDDELLSYLKRTQRYMEILRHLIGAKYVPVPAIVAINSNEVNRINEFMVECRPEDRLEKEFNGKYALLMHDATVGWDETTYAVEFKPKQGWNFDTTSQSVFNLRGLNDCRYCCMQHLKLKKGKIKSKSKYCPMDLFSGNKDKMHNAIKCLLDNPQNNLRIFKNGELLYAANARHPNALHAVFEDVGESQFYDILINSLLGPSRKGNDTPSSSCLPSHSILGTVLELQLLSKNNLQHMSTLASDDTKTYQSLQALTARTDSIRLKDLTPEEQYLIGATLMDASLMITFHRCAENKNASEGDVISVSGISYSTKVTLLDLDPKPDNHFRKFRKQTNEAYEAAFRELNSKLEKT